MKDPITTIGSIYINLMKLGVDVFMNDPPLMREWFKFTLNFPKIVSKIVE